MPSTNALKVSYCTTCMGRTHHLFGNPDAPTGSLEHDGTLCRNLEAEKDNPNVEFVILSYGKDPELDRLMHDNYQAEIDKGRIKYVVYPEAEHFKSTHAKNMAHRMATGNIVCNLDADNKIGKNFSTFLVNQFEKNPDIIVAPGLVTRALKAKLGLEGITGRIALTRENFMKLGGYGEEYDGWGGADIGLIMRSKKAGLAQVALSKEQIGNVIEHSDEARIENYHPLAQESSLQRKQRTPFQKIVHIVQRNIDDLKIEANPDGNIGCGTVYVNFSEQPTDIKPLKQLSKEQIFEENRDVSDYEASLKKDWAQRQQKEVPGTDKNRLYPR